MCILFVLIVNDHFWNYCVPLRAYAWELSFSCLDLTFCHWRYFASLLAIAISVFTFRGKYNKGKGMQIPLLHSAPKPYHSCYNCASPPTSHLSYSVVSVHRANSRRHAPLEECSTCISPNALTFFFLRYFHYGSRREWGGGRCRGGWMILIKGG